MDLVVLHGDIDETLWVHLFELGELLIFFTCFVSDCLEISAWSSTFGYKKRKRDDQIYINFLNDSEYNTIVMCAS